MPLLMLVGFQTRCIHVGLAIYTLVAAFIAHAHFGDQAQLVHLVKNMAIVGGSLAFVACGAGLFARSADVVSIGADNLVEVTIANVVGRSRAGRVSELP